MKRIKTMGLCFAAFLALGVTATSSASAALPEFLHCTKVASTVTARFATKAACEALKPEVQTKGGWEFLAVIAGEKVPFTSTSGEGTLETASGETVKCKEDTNEGEITGPKEVSKVVVKFKGCKATILGFIKVACKTSGAGTEEIVTEKLKGHIGYLNKSKKEVGQELEPEGTLFAKFECAGETVEVRGHVIGKLTPTDSMTKTTTLTFEQSGGKQKYTEFEGGPSGQILETKTGSGSFGQSAEATTDTIKTTEEGEITA
jgi:hypothetical protein